MKIPMGASRPAGGETFGLRGEDAAHDVVFAVPIAEPTSENHAKHAFDVGRDHFGRGAVEVLTGIANAADAAVAASSAAVGPEIIIILQSGNPRTLVRQRSNRRRAEQR